MSKLVGRPTAQDQRGAALLRRHGRAHRVPYKTHWTCGPSRLAHSTVLRLLDRGWARYDEESRMAVVPTEATPRGPNPEDGDEPEDGLWPRGATDPAVDATDDEAWAPPDYRDEDDRPIEVDEVLKEDWE